MIRKCDFLGGKYEDLVVVWNTTRPLPAKVFMPINEEIYQSGLIIEGRPGDEEYHLGFDGHYHFVGYMN